MKNQRNTNLAKIHLAKKQLGLTPTAVSFCKQPAKTARPSAPTGN